MRVAFLVYAFPSLSQTFILDQITGLIDRGCELDIYAERAEGPHVHPAVETYSLRQRTHYLPAPDNYIRRALDGARLASSGLARSPQIVLRSLNVLKYGVRAASLKLLYDAMSCSGKSYDVVHGHFGPNGLRGMMLREIGAIQGKLVTSFYGYDVASYVRQHGQRCYGRLFKEGNLFIALSEAMRRRLVELGCDESKVIVHHLGVSRDRFSGEAWRPSADGQARIVTISRLVPKKGVEYGIRAAAELSKAGHSLTYTIVGDGPLRAQLERLVRDLGLGGVVYLVGWKRQPDIVDILNRSDILIAPSITGEDGDQEGTPVVLMEAQAAGLPVVSTWHSGIPEVVQDGVSGYLVPEQDVAALAEKLAHLVEHPQVRIEMGRAGREIVKGHYNIDTLNDRLVEIYRALTDG